MSGEAPLTNDMQASVAAGVAALPERLDASTAARAVRQLAILTTNAEAAESYPGALAAARRAAGAPAVIVAAAPRRTVSTGYSWWSVIAFALGLIAPALVLAGFVSSSGPDPASMALASGVFMAIALGMFVWLEPLRTSSPLYRGGNFAGGLFIFNAVLWALAALVLLGRFDDLVGDPVAVIGLVVQVLASIGCAVLAVFAIRHDRERPRWAGRNAAESSAVRPAARTAASLDSPEVQRLLDEWRLHVWRVSSAAERAALTAAETRAVRLLVQRGSLTVAQADEVGRVPREGVPGD